MTESSQTVPADLASTVEAHGKAVAAGDNPAVLADFLPDRIGQLIASARVPAALDHSEVRSIIDVGDGLFDAVIRYFESDDSWFELRSRWTFYVDGTWRVLSVRNIPDTSPWTHPTGPSDDGLDAPHWDGLRDGKLVMQRCSSCRTWVWSPRPICPNCHSFEMVWEKVEPTGTIFSWTRTWQPFAEESSGHLPYVVLVVELPAAGGRRIVGVLSDADGITPRIGAAVSGHIEQPPDDCSWPLMRWRLEATPA